MGLSIDVAAVGGYAVVLPYLIVALKRVYAESTGVWKRATLFVFTIAINALVNFAAIRLTFALA